MPGATQNSFKKGEISQELFGITSKEFDQGSEQAFLNTLEYTVSELVPLILDTIQNKSEGDLKKDQENFSEPKFSFEKGQKNDMKNLLSS